MVDISKGLRDRRKYFIRKRPNYDQRCLLCRVQVEWINTRLRVLRFTKAFQQVLMHDHSSSAMVVPFIGDPNVVMKLDIFGKFRDF